MPSPSHASFLCLLLIGCTTHPLDALPSADFLVADQQARTITHVSDMGSDVWISAETLNEPLFAPSALLTDDTSVWFADFNSGHVYQRGLHSQQTARYFSNPHQPPRVEEPVALVQQDSGHLWLLGNDSQNIMAINRDGGLDYHLSLEQMRHAHDMLIEPTGEFLVVTSPYRTDIGMIQRFSSQTGNRTDHLLEPAFDHTPTSLTSFGDEVVVADWSQHHVTMVDRWTGESRLVFGDDRLVHPIDVVHQDEMFWVLDAVGIHGFSEDGEYLNSLYLEDPQFPRSLAALPRPESTR